jgi:hypothetical protein
MELKTLQDEAGDLALRKARLAMAAHLDALAVVQDAKSLRLDYLRSLLLKQLPETSAMRGKIMLRLPPEDEARLLLDLKSSVAMAADGRSYRLEDESAQGRVLALESPVVEEIANEVLRRDALETIAAAQVAAPNRETHAHGGAPAGVWIMPALLFLTGVIFGGAGLAALAIYLKKISF